MASYDFERGELDFLDIIAIISFFIGLLSYDIGLKNLSLNQQQVDGLMREMTDKQDKLLVKAIEQNSLIIDMLSETKEQNEILIKQNEVLIDLLTKK